MQTSGRVVRGFNAWDEEYEAGYWDTTTGEKDGSGNWRRNTNLIPVVPNNGYYFNMTPGASGSFGALLFYDANKKFLSYLSTSTSIVDNIVTMPADCYYIAFYANKSWFDSPICINLARDNERNGEYEPYTERTYPLDSSLTLRGIPKLDSNNQLYYDGDRYEPDGTVRRRYGIVDLGTLTWVYISERFRAPLNNAVEPAATSAPNAITTNYQFYSASVNFGSLDKAAAIITGGGNNLLIRDISYTNAASFKTAMSGVYLIYELATETTETAEPYVATQWTDPYGTEEFIDAGDRYVAVPVGHKTL